MICPLKTIIFGVTLLLCINGSVFGFLFLKEWLREPTAEELEAQKERDRQAQMAAIYAKLPPLEEFKSKKDYLRSMSEAIHLCESELHRRVTQPKSWEVNMIESRYKPKDEMYLIFLSYETAATVDTEKKYVLCDL